jgi:hypothetical protein
VLKISGVPYFASASSTASMQKSLFMLIDTRLELELELTRFRGHLILGKEGAHDAEIARPIRA